MKLPIAFYWPGKSVPLHLERISFSGKSHGAPIFQHHGFGVIVKAGGKYLVFMLSGSFLYINGAGMSCELQGGGAGVEIYTSLPRFIDAIRVRSRQAA